jgi:serine/threonine protein kinase
MTDLTVPRNSLGRLDHLGKGGTAVVYSAPDVAIPGVPSVVYKEYNRATLQHAGPALTNSLLPFVRFREKLDPKLRSGWDTRIVWPLRIVVDERGAATGILMPLIEQRFFQTIRARSGRVSQAPREVDLLFGPHSDLARIGVAPIHDRTRLVLVARIATVYALMHKRGVVVGDVSARNIVYDPAASSPAVLIVDADSARIRGSRSAFSSQPHTPHWEPPEALAAMRALAAARKAGAPPSELQRYVNRVQVQNEATDVYKFGLMVLRILTPARGTSVNRDPARAIRILRQAHGLPAADLMASSCAVTPTDRPSMRDWHMVLTGRNIAPSGSPPTVDVRSQEESASPSARSRLEDGQVNGNWVYVEGTGWTRRRPASANPAP